MPVKKYNRLNRPSPYGVKWSSDGKRKFKFFKNLSARDTFFLKLLKQEKILGNSLLTLSADEASTIRQCIKMVGDISAVILACREYAEKTKLVDIRLVDAIAEYLKEKTLLGRDENYHRAIRNILNRCAEDLPVLKNWTDENCHQWALSLTGGYAPVTIKNHVKALNAFCIWCMNKKYIRSNPFKNAPIPDVIPHEIKYLSVNKVKILFETAIKHYPEAVAYLALNTFAGLRSSVCARLNVDAIDFKQKGIVIAANIAKNKRRVYLDGYEGNLWLWLSWAKKNAPEGFKLTKRQWDEIRSKVAKKAEPEIKMPHNALRHTFCTYHVALYGDAGKTATLLTHRGNVSILYEHYKGNAANSEAKKFWKIKPGK